MQKKEKRRWENLGTKDDHLKTMEKKSRISREKFEFQMLGVGLFSDFDKFKKDVKTLKKIRGKI